jgi:hypothetical protein
LQALAATVKRGLLAARCCAVALRACGWIVEGSGNVGTPWERMQREKATAAAASFCVVVVAAVMEEATLATLGEPPPPQPAASSENATTATTDVRMTGRRQRTMFGSLQSRAEKAHHRNLNVSALRLRGC